MGEPQLCWECGEPTAGPRAHVCPMVPIRLSGAAWHVVRDGHWQRDCPRGWAAIEAGESVKVGKGRQIKTWMSAGHAIDLAQYLEGVAAVNSEMTAGSSVGTTAAKAAERIRAALDDRSAWRDPESS